MTQASKALFHAGSIEGGHVACGLLLLRLAVGGIMAAPGAQKLFGWWGPGLRGTIGTCDNLAYRIPFLRFNLLIASSAVALAVIGPGRFSLDHAIGWDDNISGVWWGVGVAGVAIVVAFLGLTVGRRRPKVAEMPA
jgi:uncharacterized membrane protein YphA (DoxX/SURF4 family)